MEKKVLCVDDEEDILMMLAELFRSEGYAAQTTTDGSEALELIKQERIPVVFTDLRMPKMDGMELCQEIKKLDFPTRVFAISAYVDFYNIEQMVEAGFESHFPKPFNMEAVLAECHRAFEQLEAEGSAS